MICCISILLLTGMSCRNVSYRGITYDEFKFGTTVSAKRLQFNVTETNASVEIEGYNANQTDAISAAAEGAAKGAMKGLVPKP